MSKRLDYLDMAKGIGVILVLLGHLQGERFFNFSPYILPMCEWIFSFHMPLFFIVSGMLINHKDDVSKDINSLAKKRFRGIMIPYFWFSAFYLCVVIYALINGTVYPSTLYVNIWYVFSMYGMNVLWFLPALFMSELLFIYIMKKFDRKISVMLITSMGIIAAAIAYFMTKVEYASPLANRLHEFCQMLIRPFLACTFIAVGFWGYELIKRVFSRPEDNYSIRNKIKGFISSKAGNIIVGLILMIIAGIFVKVNHGVDFRSLVLKNLFFYYLCAIFSSIGLILICKGLPTIKLLTFFGVNSLIFMATHNSETILYFALKFSMFINQFLTRARGYICYASIVLIILIYVAVMIVIINKFFPFIIGKPYVNPFSPKKGEKIEK